MMEHFEGHEKLAKDLSFGVTWFDSHFYGWEQAEGRQIQEQGKQLGGITITENTVAWGSGGGENQSKFTYILEVLQSNPVEIN